MCLWVLPKENRINTDNKKASQHSERLFAKQAIYCLKTAIKQGFLTNLQCFYSFFVPSALLLSKLLKVGQKSHKLHKKTSK